jgi:UDP-glucose 4-epimerase
VRINADGTLAVLEAAARAGVKKLLLASSAAIYGDNPLVPKTETMLPEPKSPYAVTKLDGEYYLAMFAATRGLATAALRFFNVFGPRQDPASAYAAAVPIFIAKALANDPITIFGDGEQTRDFIHVKDIVSALVHLAMESPAQGVFNCGYGAALSINSLAERIVATAASSSKILHLPERPGDVKHSRASVEKLHATGWRPVSSLDNGLAETLAWFTAQKR